MKRRRGCVHFPTLSTSAFDSNSRSVHSLYSDLSLSVRFFASAAPRNPHEERPEAHACQCRGRVDWVEDHVSARSVGMRRTASLARSLARTHAPWISSTLALYLAEEEAPLVLFFDAFGLRCFGAAGVWTASSSGFSLDALASSRPLERVESLGAGPPLGCEGRSPASRG